MNNSSKTTDSDDAKVFFIQKTECKEEFRAENARNLQKRIQSFRKNGNWTSKKSIIQLAVSGFRYTGEGDKVECEWCYKRVFQWKAEDDPLETHFRISPDCYFILGLGYSIDLQIPKYRRFSQPQKRLDSMQKLPPEYLDDIPSFETIVASGFFYIGTLDRMVCFHCGLVLRDWETDTVPNEVHVQFGQKCLFISNLLERETNGRDLRLKLINSKTSTSGSSKTSLVSETIVEVEPQISSTVSSPVNPPNLTTCQLEALRENQSMLFRSGLFTAESQKIQTDALTPKIPQQHRPSFIQRPIGRFADRGIEVDAIDSSKKSTCSSNTTGIENTSNTNIKSRTVLTPSNISSQTSRTEFVSSGATSSPALTPVEQAVLEMGYSAELVNEVIIERRERGEGNFKDATSLCLAVMDLAEKLDR